MRWQQTVAQKSVQASLAQRHVGEAAMAFSQVSPLRRRESIPLAYEVSAEFAERPVWATASSLPLAVTGSAATQPNCDA